MNDRVFSKRDTTLVKCIAIVLLILHHLLGIDPGMSFHVFASPIVFAIGSSGKACVSLFLILSGYGMMERTKQSDFTGCVKYTLVRMKKMYLHYWSCYLVLFIWAYVRGYKVLSEIYYLGRSSDGPLNLAKDLFGIADLWKRTPMLTGVSWFIGAIAICYLLFPLFHIALSRRKADKILAITILILLYLPWVYYLWKADRGMHTDRPLFYFFSFFLGIVLSRYQILNWVKRMARHWWTAIISAGLLVLCVTLRGLWCMPFDPVLSVSIIIFAICTVCRLPDRCFLVRGMLSLGTVEADIYLLHEATLTVLASVGFTGLLSRSVCSVAICWAIGFAFFSMKERIKGMAKDDFGRAVAWLTNKRK